MPLSRPLESSYDVIIIGAGASGLMCAQTAGYRGRKVLVLDHANKIGKKILISGGGRCNFTNMYTEPSNYLSQNPHFCKSSLARYTQWDFQGLVAKYDIPWHEKTLGQLFCDNRSQDIVDLLMGECREAGVTVRAKAEVQKVVADKDRGFQLITSQGEFSAQSLVVATGGLSFPTMGATGFGYEIAEQFGHALIEQVPGLVPFTLSKKWLNHFSDLSGVSAEVTLSCNEQSFRENLLITHRGVSGPAVLQISSYWNPGDRVMVNWLPGINTDDWLQEAIQQRPKAQISNVISEHLTKRLAQTLCDYGKLRLLTDNGRKPVAQFTLAELDALADELTNWGLEPTGTEGYKKAEVTLGGVATEKVSSKTLESQLQPGLFFVGEVLDVTGHLGGFNFQWAWASGHCAGQYV
ncbi:aminoacetone oxidase family FAD-binding enzyme [Endozoicomonas sp. OPT23]|uniref:NAD(P)/FAD-dependent oxidoreductase n=1 Tax=Endozoicomonas sp. OPT23 TaxID=2072845 RepID=UPI00129AFB4E|nr:NAD(P)/FAD-dependent oxidoreductase [Endozoicomonas sp. OPT23]MRI31373.1 aminoacetone oxidase family FAD-binding enzyme [Endozoicomonas sp. OPT23]